MLPAIKIENLSKQYRLGTVGTGTLSHDLKRWWATNIRGKEDPYLKIGEANDRAHKGSSDYVWALKDINLDVAQGEVLGIIGKNGAGKSTLLKILSKVTKPSTGTIKYRGRIASLLEVGTGFHPEMTGRENIYMNGAIMGMTKTEITRKFDEIVDFAGVERYIDTPVKRYSSGMTVRLGFSIAAHLEPDILVIDEVLAVGDAEFQQKAIGKMQEVSQGGGRTVLFVSHNLGSIQQLCSSGILLKEGKISFESINITDVIKNYLGHSESIKISHWKNPNLLFENEYLVPLEIFVSNQNNEISENGVVSNSEETFINMIFEIKKTDPYMTIGYSIFDEFEQLLFWSYQTDSSVEQWPLLNTGINHLIATLPKNVLNEGNYRIELCGGIHRNQWFFQPGASNPCIFLTIQGGLSNSPYWTEKRPGILAPINKWYNRKE